MTTPDIRTLEQLREEYPRAAARYERERLTFGEIQSSAAIERATRELEQPPAPGPIWTNGQALEDTRPACPPWCMTATAMHDTGPAAMTRTHRANVLTFDTHDDDDMPVPLAVDLERIDHRTPTGWEAGPTRLCLMVGTAFYGGPPVYLTAAEATHLAMSTFGAMAVMR